ncbi:MAG: TPM domain-containing protein [bacterium]|nr:TPM domain-containing protein [bacterium]
MLKKGIFRVTAALFTVMSCAFVLRAQDDLRPTGYVNDFANLLSAEGRARLETALREYEQKTSIEIAVVTVASLNGDVIENFTQELWEKWGGIGKKGKDNGVMFVIAPNERKMRIQTGYGVEGDLTDAQCNRIIQLEIAPLFKAGKMEEGIITGVAGIIRELGTTPFETRLAEREDAVKKRAAAAQARSEATARFFKIVGLVVLIVAPFIALFIIVSVKKHREAKARQREREAEEARKNGPKLLAALLGRIQKTEKSIKKASAGAHAVFEKAQVKYRQVEVASKKVSVDWVALVALMLAVHALLEDAENYDIRPVHRRAASAPRYVPVDSSFDDDDDDDSSSSSFGGGSGFGGGSSGGFGGGRSGGGGASGGW